MTETTWARICAACGAPAVLLLIAGNEVAKIGGGSPPLHASPRVYADAVGTPAASLVGGFLVVLGLCLFVPFFASLAGTLRRAAGDRELLATVLLGGGLVTVAVGRSPRSPARLGPPAGAPSRALKTRSLAHSHTKEQP